MRKFFLTSIVAITSLTGCASLSSVDRNPGHVTRYNSDAVNYFVDGVINDLTGDVSSAIDKYELALLQDTSSNTIVASLAQDHLALGEYDRSYELIRRSLARNPRHIESLECLAELYMRSHDFSKAAETLRQITGIDPGNLESRYRLIALLELQGKSEDLAEQYSFLLDYSGPNTLLAMKLGDLYVKNKSYDKAASVLSKALVNDRGNVFLLDALGQAYAMNKDLTNAIKTYEQLLDNKPDDGAVHARIGSLAIQKGDYEKGVEHLKQAEGLFPKNGDIKRSIGFALTQLDKNFEAVAYFEKAIEFNPSDIFSMSLLAPIYQEKKEFEKSDGLFEKILVLDPGNDIILNNYSYSLAERNLKLEKALKMIQKAMEKSPNNSHYMDTIGWIYFQMGQTDQAYKYVIQSYRINSSSWEVADHLGDIFKKLNKRDEAVNYWKRALELNPGNASITKKIDTFK